MSRDVPTTLMLPRMKFNLKRFTSLTAHNMPPLKKRVACSPLFTSIVVFHIYCVLGIGIHLADVQRTIKLLLLYAKTSIFHADSSHWRRKQHETDHHHHHHQHDRREDVLPNKALAWRKSLGWVNQVNRANPLRAIDGGCNRV